MKRPVWFKRKTYGWGWYPSTWQGWAILGAYTGGLIATFRDIDSTSHSGSETLVGFFLPLAGLTVILLVITVLTGEKPRWQWPGDKSNNA